MNPDGNQRDALEGFLEQLRLHREAGDQRRVEDLFGCGLRQPDPSATRWLLIGLLVEEARLAGAERRPVEVYLERLRAFCPDCTDAEERELEGRLRVLTLPVVAAAGLPQVGQELGGYLLVEVLGRGGMGVVFRAEEAGLIEPPPQYALKVIAPGTGSATRAREDALLRFAREAKLTHALRRIPGVVSILRTGRDRGVAYYVMDLVVGRSLRERLNAPGGVPPLEAARLVERLARIVDQVNQPQVIDGIPTPGVVHRDLKPENVMLTADGEVRLVDFGVAAAAAPLGDAAASPAEPTADAQRVTRAGEFVGTLRYAAPERRNGVDASPVSEVFSLGAILYELLVGRWSEADGEAARCGRLDLRPLRDADVPEHLEAVCRRALTPDPCRRLASAGRLAEALAQDPNRVGAWSVDPLWSEHRLQDTPRNHLRDQPHENLSRCARDAASCAALLRTHCPDTPWENDLLVAVVASGVAARIHDTRPDSAAVEEMRQAVRGANPWMRPGEVYWAVGEWLTLLEKRPAVPPEPPPTLWQRLGKWLHSERRVTWPATALVTAMALLGSALGLARFWGWERVRATFEQTALSPVGMLPGLLLVVLAGALYRPVRKVAFVRGLLSDGLAIGGGFVGGFAGGLVVGEWGLLDWDGHVAAVALYLAVALAVANGPSEDGPGDVLVFVLVPFAALLTLLALGGLASVGVGITNGFAAWVLLAVSLVVALSLAWGREPRGKPTDTTWPLCVVSVYGLYVVWSWCLYADLERMVYHPEQPTALAASPHHPFVAVGDDAGYVSVHDPDLGMGMALTRRSGTVLALAFSPNGRFVAASSGDLVREKNGREEFERCALWVGDVFDRGGTPHEAELPEPCVALAFRPGTLTLAAGYERSLWMHGVIDGVPPAPTPAYSLAGVGKPLAVAFRGDGRVVATSARDLLKRQQPVCLFDFGGTGPPRKAGEIPVGDTQVFRVAYLPDGVHLLTAESDGVVRRWHAPTGKEIGRYVAGTDPVTRLAVSPDGSRLATGGGENVVRLWDVETGRLLRSYPAGGTVDLAFLDASRLFGVGRDRSLRTWRVP